MISEWEIALRLVLSFIFGGIIGYERQARHKSAGFRTNILVCLGSCLIMIMSYEVFAMVEGRTNADPARLAAQVVSGIGFLGAGAIMKEGLTVTGLTTAACLWVVAGVGLAVGGGFYLAAALTTLIVFLTLGYLGRFDSLVDSERPVRVVVLAQNVDGLPDRISEVLEDLRLSINRVRIKNEGFEPERDGDSCYLHIEIDAYNAFNVSNAVIAEKIRDFDEVLSIEVI